MNTPKMSIPSPMQWTRTWANLRSERVKHDWATEQQPGVLTLVVNERDADQVCCFSKLSSGQRTAGRRKRIMIGGSDPGGRGSRLALESLGLPQGDKGAWKKCWCRQGRVRGWPDIFSNTFTLGSLWQSHCIKCGRENAFLKSDSPGF